MRVLIGCEESQIGCLAFRARGHEAYSCDIIECSGGHPEWHIQGDVLDVLDDGWDLGIFHDPCTYQCNSGVRWLHEVPGRWAKLEESCIFTRKLLDAPIEKIARENPIPHKYAIELIGRKYDQIVQPWMFGHPESKATCWWLRKLPPLQPTDIVDGRDGRVWKMPPSKDRTKLRSKSYPGMLAAAAAQWG